MATLINIKNRKSDKAKSKSKPVRKKKKGMKSMTTDDLDEMISKLRTPKSSHKSHQNHHITSPQFVNKSISTDSRSTNKRSKTPSRKPKIKASTSNIYFPRSPPSKSTSQLIDRRNDKSKNENQQINKLKKEKTELKSQINELKEEISILKSKTETSNEYKYNNNNNAELEYKYQHIQNEILKTKNENEIEIQNVNNKHKKEIESLQSVIENMKFEQIKLNKELEHKEKLYEQKLANLDTDIKGKETLNEQMKVLKNNVEKQLEIQINLTNEIMDELDETRKKQYVRVPRNNSMVTVKLINDTPSGCCSSWWGKQNGQIIADMEPKVNNTNDFESE